MEFPSEHLESNLIHEWASVVIHYIICHKKG